MSNEGSPFLHEKLKEMLEERGVSQSSLADKVGVSQPYMNQLVNGDRVPSLNLLRSICGELQVEAAEFLAD